MRLTINLGNYENTLSHYLTPSYLKQGNDVDVAALIKDMNAGKYCSIDLLIM